MTSPAQPLRSGADARPPLILQPGSPLGRLTSKEPWSPQDRDSTPFQIKHSRNMDYDDDVAPSSLLREGLRRREPSSESAIDDYDLGDYTRMVQTNQPEHNTDHRHATTSNIYGAQVPDRIPTVPPEYPPAPILSRPFSTDRYPSYYPQSPSVAYHQDSYSRQFPIDPRSLPNFLAPFSPPVANRFIPTPDSLATPRTPNTESDMDISHFPAYTRAWYDKDPNASNSNGWHSNNSRQSDGSGLPWNMDRDNVTSGSAIDPIMKRERIRMLEHDFGKDAVEAAQKAHPIIGSVDANGKLITAGPRKRALVRWVQALLALLGGISALYGALFIKPKTGHAPPASTAPAFVLYAAFILSFCLSVYLFVFRPCCGKRDKPDSLDATGNGMFVLPVQGFTGQQQKKKKGKKNQGNASDVHINLIIDPRMLRQQGERDRSDADDDMLSSSQAATTQTGDSGNRRRTVFEGLALENQWKRARSFLRKLFAVDMLCLVVWGAVFVFALLGKKCPPGGFDGWCTSYNTAVACSCFLCLAFGCSIFFDIVDLHASRVSPRTRT